MFVDASAICAIALLEPERTLFESKIAAADRLLISPIAFWEAMRAIVRETGLSPAEASAELQAYLDGAGFRTVAIGVAEQDAAIAAFARFGKGRHPARLNMGDCFAYAYARTNGAPLLFKGDDFSQTDVAAA